jgi:hypothetical protein
MITSFFLDDLFEGNLTQVSGWHPGAGTGNYKENMSDPRPRIAWISGGDSPGQSGFAQFTITDSNKYVDFSATAANVFKTIVITPGFYTSATLCAALNTKLAAALGNLKYWDVTYNDATGKFRIGVAAGSSVFEDYMLRFATGPNVAVSMGPTLGFAAEDYPDLIEHFAPNPSYSNHTFVHIDLGVSPPKLNMILCDLETEDPDGTVDTSTVKVYGNTTSLGGGHQLQNWEDNAQKNLTFSAEPEHPENKIRIAFDSDGADMQYRFWLFSWQHTDPVQRHKIRLLKAFRNVWNSPRTIQTLTGHGLVGKAAPLGINNYYPVNQLRRWRVPLSFDAWTAAGYRNVIHRVVRFGKQKGFVWALRWDDIASGSVDASSEADEGYLVWCALHRYSQDTYVGEGAAYISGELMLEQVR